MDEKYCKSFGQMDMFRIEICGSHYGIFGTTWGKHELARIAQHDSGQWYYFPSSLGSFDDFGYYLVYYDPVNLRFIADVVEQLNKERP